MWDASKRYDQYYSSGTYDQRYPSSNSATLEILKDDLPSARRILDFGCGNGRYIPSFLEKSDAAIVAFDICSTAVGEVKRKHPQGRVTALTGNQEQLRELGPFDLVVCLFGVLSHIAQRSERLATLSYLASLLDSQNGQLVISVPSKLRRFCGLTLFYSLRRAVNRPIPPAFEAGDIVYIRRMDGEKTRMFYHLYSPGELVRDLEHVGLVVRTLRCECVFPESWVTRNSLVRTVDGWLRRIVPPIIGYGILAKANRRRGHADTP